MIDHGRCAILTYHSLDDSGSVISTAPHMFRRHIEILRQEKIPVFPLAEIRQKTGGVALTFDDGFENVREHALPLLAEYGIPATVFVVSEYCGRHNNWPTQSAAVPRLPLMSWAGLRELVAAGWELGGHTVSHPYLTALSPAAAEREMVQARQEIEQRTAAAVQSFAYPYGAVNFAISQIAAAHFDRSCGTRLDFVSQESDDKCLARIDAFYLQGPRRLQTLLQSSGRRYIAMRRWAREARQCFSR